MGCTRWTTGGPVSWEPPFTVPSGHCLHWVFCSRAGRVCLRPWHLAQGFPLSLQAKVEMLDNLLDIEVAYSLLRGGSDDSSKDPIDVNYEKLKTEIKVTGPTFLTHPLHSPQVRGPQASMCVSWRASQLRWLGPNPGLAVVSQVLSLESRRPFPRPLSTWVSRQASTPRPQLAVESGSRGLTERSFLI